METLDGLKKHVKVKATLATRPQLNYNYNATAIRLPVHSNSWLCPLILNHLL